jgi:hypothetical protein
MQTQYPQTPNGHGAKHDPNHWLPNERLDTIEDCWCHRDEVVEHPNNERRTKLNCEPHTLKRDFHKGLGSLGNVQAQGRAESPSLSRLVGLNRFTI